VLCLCRSKEPFGVCSEKETPPLDLQNRELLMKRIIQKNQARTNLLTLPYTGNRREDLGSAAKSRIITKPKTSSVDRSKELPPSSKLRPHASFATNKKETSKSEIPLFPFSVACDQLKGVRLHVCVCVCVFEFVSSVEKNLVPELFRDAGYIVSERDRLLFLPPGQGLL